MNSSRGTYLLYALLALALLCCVFLVLLLNRDKQSISTQPNTQEVRQLPPVLPAVFRDSLKQVFTQAVTGLNNQVDSGVSYEPALKQLVDKRIEELYKLQQEINELLKNNGSIADLQQAKQKIEELQLLVNELRQRTTNTETENSRLYALLKKYMDDERGRNTNAEPVAAGKPATPSSKPAIGSLISVSEIEVTAQDENNTETRSAAATNELVIAFELRNYNQQNPNSEMHVVVLKPDGKVLKNSEWEMGTFETINGRKIYSFKTRISLDTDESRKVRFSLNADEYPSGSYSIQFFHDGKLVARTTKSLS